jgi:hypothetical protein
MFWARAVEAHRRTFRGDVAAPAGDEITGKQTSAAKASPQRRGPIRCRPRIMRQPPRRMMTDAVASHAGRDLSVRLAAIATVATATAVATGLCGRVYGANVASECASATTMSMPGSSPSAFSAGPRKRRSTVQGRWGFDFLPLRLFYCASRKAV